jgi:UDPglucose 6-dehydrogenase
VKLCLSQVFILTLVIGGPTAAVLAFQHPEIRVTVVDKDTSRIRRWSSAHLPIHELGLSDLVRVARDGALRITVPLEDKPHAEIDLPARLPNLFFSTEVAKGISEADIIFLCVNTNTKANGIGAGVAPDMVALENSIKEIGSAAKPGTIIVEKSTVPCRTGQIICNIVSFALSIHDILAMDEADTSLTAREYPTWRAF